MRYLAFFCFILISSSCWGDNFISDDEIALIRKDPELVLSSYLAHMAELEEALGAEFSDLNDNELFVVYCSLVAYYMAPFGQSNAIDLENMLQATHLNCGNYTILTTRLAEAGVANISQLVHLPIVGFEGPALLNYCILFIVRSDHKDLLLDPTTSAIARISLDDFLSGIPINPEKIKRFSNRGFEQVFWDRLSNTLINGKLRPSELLYYFHSVGALIRNMPLTEASATPRAQMLQFGPKNY